MLFRPSKTFLRYQWIPKSSSSSICTAFDLFYLDKNFREHLALVLFLRCVFMKLHRELVNKFLMENYDKTFGKFKALLQSTNYVTRRQSLKLLGEILLHKSNFQIMMKFIRSFDPSTTSIYPLTWPSHFFSKRGRKLENDHDDATGYECSYTVRSLPRLQGIPLPSALFPMLIFFPNETKSARCLWRILGLLPQLRYRIPPKTKLCSLILPIFSSPRTWQKLLVDNKVKLIKFLENFEKSEDEQFIDEKRLLINTLEKMAVW